MTCLDCGCRVLAGTVRCYSCALAIRPLLAPGLCPRCGGVIGAGRPADDAPRCRCLRAGPGWAA